MCLNNVCHFYEVQTLSSYCLAGSIPVGRGGSPVGLSGSPVGPSGSASGEASWILCRKTQMLKSKISVKLPNVFMNHH